LVKKSSAFFEVIKETISAGVNATKKAAQAAGLAIALASGSGDSDEAPSGRQTAAQSAN
jgi:hypothetical protein